MTYIPLQKLPLFQISRFPILLTIGASCTQKVLPLTWNCGLSSSFASLSFDRTINYDKYVTNNSFVVFETPRHKLWRGSFVSSTYISETNALNLSQLCSSTDSDFEKENKDDFSSASRKAFVPSLPLNTNPPFFLFLMTSHIDTCFLDSFIIRS